MINSDESKRYPQGATLSILFCALSPSIPLLGISDYTGSYYYRASVFHLCFQVINKALRRETQF